jgi:hypothetical protein
MMFELEGDAFERDEAPAEVRVRQCAPKARITKWRKIPDERLGRVTGRAGAS